jgi:hypothetical protein
LKQNCGTLKNVSAKAGMLTYGITRDAGFDNDAAMYHFIKRHRGISPREWKEEYEK